MDFFGFPKEIRLQIYSELLVHPEPIVFVADDGPPSPPLFRSRRDGLCSALLQLNKQAHSEASSLLYSNNRFQFPDILNQTDCAYIAPFLLQIGPQVNLVRHICISFPTFDDFRHGRACLHEAHIKNLELIRNTCTSITTLELSLDSDRVNYALRDSPVAEQALDLLDARFKAIRSLKEVIVNFQVRSQEDLSGDQVKMRDRGWTVKITKKKWISENGLFQFDNEEQCEVYDEGWRYQERQRKYRREMWWKKEFYRRRRDPYWMNRSDYD